MRKLFKVTTAMVAAVMIIGCNLTVFAAPSAATVSATASDVSAVAATLEDGSVVTVVTVTEEKVIEAQQATVTVMGQDASKLQIEKCFDLQATISGPTNITIAVPGVTAGQKVVVLHQKHDGEWESVPVVDVSAGNVTATFASLSPVAIATYASPKTGEGFSFVGVVCIIALFGTAYCAKKFKVSLGE